MMLSFRIKVYSLSTQISLAIEIGTCLLCEYAFPLFECECMRWLCSSPVFLSINNSNEQIVKEID